MNIGKLLVDVLADTSQLRIGTLLRRVVDDLSGAAAVIWTAEPKHQSVASYSLNAFAYATPGTTACVIHDMPSIRSAIGRCIRDRGPVSVRNSEIAAEHISHSTFVRAIGAESFCSVPFVFADATPGALAIYHTAPRVSRAILHAARSIADVLPSLLRTIEDRASVAAIQRVDELLFDIERQARAPSTEEMRKTLASVCEEVSTTFDCFETSIYIVDSSAEPDTYSLAATTFEDVVKTKSYRPTDKALTAWVIRTTQSLLLPDLESWAADRPKIQRRYKDLYWSRSSSRRTDLRKLLGIGPDQPKPPHAFMATPLVHRKLAFGVVRCSISKAQRFFSHRDLMLLTLLATHIGTTLQNWLSMRESEDENTSWRTLVESVSRLNTFVDGELSREIPNEQRIFEEALKIAGPALGCASISDVRMIADSTQDRPEPALKFVATSGPGWNELHQSGVMRKDRTFPLAEDSAGSYVIAQRAVHVVNNPATAAEHYSGTFPHATGLISAPIETDKTVFGVLDLRKTSPAPFPPHANAIAELLGRQLGLYHRLVVMVGKLKQSEREQRDTYEDLAHQMRTPTSQAYQRAKAAVDAVATAQGTPLERNLRAIRGLCRKAHRVALCTGFFTELARGTDVQIGREELAYRDMVMMAIEAAADFAIVVEPSWNLQFRVDRVSFDVLATSLVKCDKALIEQVLNCFLDNAAKYSYRNTTVHISGGLTGKERDRFFVSVRNQGRRVKSSEVDKCKERHWRGEEATITTAEGKGIGLWISEKIMLAHGGSVHVTATDERHVTDVRMLFPTERRRKG